MIVDVNEIIVVKDWWDEFGTSVLICPCVEKHGIHCAAILSGNSDFVVPTKKFDDVVYETAQLFYSFSL